MLEPNESPQAPPEVQATGVIEKSASETNDKPVEEMSDEEFDKSYQTVVEGKVEKVDPPATAQKMESTEIEKYRKQLEDKEQFIQRQGNEIGGLRKTKGLLDTFHADPEQALKYFQEMKRARENPEGTQTYDKDELAALQFEDPVKYFERVKEIVEQRDAEIRSKERDFIKQKEQELRTLAPDIVENSQEIFRQLIEEDGLPPEQVQNIVDNLPKIPTGGLLLLNQRARLNKENRALKQRNAELESMLKSRGIEVTEAIINAQKIKASGSPQGNSAAGVAPPNKALYQKSDAEIEAFLKASGCLTD